MAVLLHGHSFNSTYYCASMCYAWLVFKQLTCDLFAIAKFLLYFTYLTLSFIFYVFYRFDMQQVSVPLYAAHYKCRMIMII